MKIPLMTEVFRRLFEDEEDLKKLASRFGNIPKQKKQKPTKTPQSTKTRFSNIGKEPEKAPEQQPAVPQPQQQPAQKQPHDVALAKRPPPGGPNNPPTPEEWAEFVKGPRPAWLPPHVPWPPPGPDPDLKQKAPDKAPTMVKAFGGK